MSFEDYTLALGPKLKGSWNLYNRLHAAQKLHRGRPSMKLDFFIMLSSAAGVVGNIGQSNYAAGSTFQDALASHSTSNGLPAVAIDLGVIQGAGFVAENKGVGENLKRQGLVEIYLEEFFGILASAINRCAKICSFEIYGAFCAGRVLIGLGIGQFTATCLFYINEVAPAEIRGPALMSFQFMQSISQLIGACITLGTQTINNPSSYRIPMGLLMVLPEPCLDVSKGRRDVAEAALRKIYRMESYNPTEDLRLIQEQVDKEREMEAESSWSSLFKDPVERRKLLFSCGAMSVQQINGIQFWYTYGVVFAQSIGVGEPFTINTIIYVLQIITVGLSVIFGNKIPRQKNLLICTIGMLCSLVAVGGPGTTRYDGSFTHSVGIAIVVFAYINIVFFNFSIGTLSYTISSEMAVGRNRNKITACSMGVFFFTVWLITFVCPYIYYSANLGPMLGFTFGGTSLICLLYIWFCVGETTGRTNHDIGQLFKEKALVRQWRTHVLEHEYGAESTKSSSSVEEIEHST